MNAATNVNTNRRRGAQPMHKWLSVNEFLDAHKGHIGRSSLYERIRMGQISHVRIGKKILIAADALDRLLVASTPDSDSQA